MKTPPSFLPRAKSEKWRGRRGAGLSVKVGLIFLLSGSGARSEPTTPGSFKDFADRLTLTIGLSTFAEIFPVSSVKIPGSARGQLSLLAGTRFSIGTRLPKGFRVLALIEAGYSSSGSRPGLGADGVSEGAGVEVALETFDRIKPFVRFMYDALVLPVRSSPEGALANSAYFISLGARVSIVEVHVSFGRDFAGGLSPGVGLSLGWLY